MITWTKENIALFKKSYPVKDNTTVAAELGITVRAVRCAATKFNVKKSNHYWSKKDIDFMKKNWSSLSADEIGIKLKRTKWAVINKYRELEGLR